MTMQKKYIEDENGNKVLPITHFSAVRNSSGDTLEDVLYTESTYDPTTYSGMGRKVLQKNMVNGVNTLTQDMMPVATGGNTIYIIRYDFTLGEDITVPANCVLEFDGGSLSGNHEVSFNNTTIKGKIKFISCTYRGTLTNDVVNINWFHNSGDDITATLQYLVSFEHIIINKGLWYISDSIILNRSNIIIEGEDKDETIIKIADSAVSENIWVLATDKEYPLRNSTGDNPETADDINIVYDNIHIKNITFNMNGATSSPSMTYIIFLKNVENSSVTNCKFIDNNSDNRFIDNQAVVFKLSQNCVISFCESQNTIFAGVYACRHCTVSDNIGTKSFTTWIETARGHHHTIKNNSITDIINNSVSAIGVNCKYCNIESNEVVISDSSGTPDNGIRVGHAGEIFNASYSIVRNNKVIMAKSASAGISAVYDSRYLIICNNTVSVTFGSVSDSKCGILCGENAVVINNNVSCNSVGIGGKPAYIENNKIVSSYKGILATGPYCEIKENDVEGTIMGIGCYSNVIVKNNDIKGYLQVYGGGDCVEIIGNRFDFTSFDTTYTSNVMRIIAGDCPTIHKNVISNKADSISDKAISIQSTSMFANPEKYNVFEQLCDNKVNSGGYTKFIVLDNNITSRNLYENSFLSHGTIRPTLDNLFSKGRVFFDETTGINKPVWWNGTTWVDATGATV